jgi:phosphatidylinositol glycan class B
MNFKKLYTENKIQIISIISLITCSIFSVGFYHPDEHYQIIEFANYKLGHTNASQLPWEFHERIRPTIQPIIALSLIKFLKIFNIFSPFLATIILRLISSLLCFYTLKTLYNYYHSEFEDTNYRKLFKILSFLSWFLIFIGARYTSENWSACLIIIGFIHLLKNQSYTTNHFFLSGVFLGLAFIFRFQSGFIILGIYLWLIFIQKTIFKYLFILSSAILTLIILGFIIDSWFYRCSTFTALNYLMSFLSKNAPNFGTEPWWFFFKEGVEKGIPPLSIMLVLTFLYFIFKNYRNPITWSVLPFIIFHFFIDHKELRFLFPIFYFLPYIVSKSIRDIGLIISTKKQIALNRIMQFLIVINLIVVLIISFRPMTTKTYLFQFLYSKFPSEKTIYYTDINPYEEISFYKKNKLKMVKINYESIVKNSTYKGRLIITIPQKKSLFKNKSILFQTYPDWLYSFNIGNWIGKSEQYLIYKI